MNPFAQFLYDFFVAISPALQVLLQSVAVALVGMATAYVRKAYQTKKAELSVSQQDLLGIIVGNAVMAAQQVSDTNEAKLAYAFSTAEKSLAQYGLSVDVDVIYAMIEAKVFEKKSYGDLPKSTFG